MQSKIPSKNEVSVVEQWTAKLPLASILSTLLPPNIEDIANITREQADEIARIFSRDIVDVLLENASVLKVALSHDSKSNSNTKFGTFEGNFGTITSFHKNIYDKIGNPNPQWEVAMQKEHLNSTDKFSSSNYRIESCASDEWHFVVDGVPPPAESMGHGRVLHPIEHYMGLEVTTRAGLTRPEVIALVLYTGPMFMIWNTILRQFPVNLYDSLKEQDTLFPSSIFVLMSAIQKVSRVMELKPGQLLYRGIDGNMTLPSHFTVPDTNGCLGMMEFGFMSTTADMNVAISYSGVDKGKAFPKVFEIRVGSVDRGADIRDFSQYPSEKEYLWAPHAFIEPIGGNEVVTTPHGLVEVIKVRVNSNLKAVTVEEYEVRKKDLHMNSFKIQLQDLRLELYEMALDSQDEDQAMSFIEICLTECDEIRARHEERAPEEFNDDTIYRSLVSEMLESKSHAIMKAEKLLSFPADTTFDYDRQIWSTRSLKNVFRIRVDELMQSLESNTNTTNTLALIEKFGLGKDVPDEEVHALNAKSNASDALNLCRKFGLARKDVDELNDLGETPLIAACADGVPDEKLELLIGAGCDVNARVSYEGDNQYKDMTPLLICSFFGRRHQVTILAKHGADLNAVAKTSDEFSNMGAVYLAAWAGHVRTIRALHELGASINEPDSAGFTPLLTAAYYNQAAAIETLHELGADIEARPNNGWTVVLVAADANHVASVEMLHKLGADVNAKIDGGDLDGLSPLWQACQRGHVATVRALLRCKADPTAVYSDLTPKQVAEESDNAELLEAFEAAGL